MNSKNVFKMAVGMLACCLVPVLIIFAVTSFGIASGNKIIATIYPFLCPIMMVGMILFMGRKGHNHNGHSCCHGGSEESKSVNKVEQ